MIKEYLKGKKYGFYVTVASAVLCIITVIIYSSIYGETRYLSRAAIVLLVCGVVVAIVLEILKQHKLAPVALLLGSFIAFLLYIYYIYFFVSSVLVGIQFRAGFPPEFIVNAVFYVLTLVTCVVNVFLPQVKESRG